MNFLAAVNRLLRIEHIIQGDDDDITSFGDSQHAADTSLAQIAIQDEIIELTSERLIDYEHTTGTITLVASQRSYSLANDFVRFFGKPSFLDTVQNSRIWEYVGGEKSLMLHDYQYKTITGSPNFWYWDSTTTKKVAFWNVPDSSFDQRSLSYDYEKSVLVSDTTDTIPFHNNEEAYTFVDMAARRFNFMINKKERGLLTQDSTYSNAKSRLYQLIKPTDAKQYYGKRY